MKKNIFVLAFAAAAMILAVNAFADQEKASETIGTLSDKVDARLKDINKEIKTKEARELEQMFDEAEKLYNDGEYKEASALYKKINKRLSMEKGKVAKKAHLRKISAKKEALKQQKELLKKKKEEGRAKKAAEKKAKQENLAKQREAEIHEKEIKRAAKKAKLQKKRNEDMKARAMENTKRQSMLGAKQKQKEKEKARRERERALKEKYRRSQLEID